MDTKLSLRKERKGGKKDRSIPIVAPQKRGARTTKKITSEDINEAVEKYLREGGEIKKFKPCNRNKIDEEIQEITNKDNNAADQQYLHQHWGWLRVYRER